MRFATFDGGLSTRLAPHLIGPNEGVIYQNINNSVGHFLPITDKVDVTEEFDLTEEMVDEFGYYFAQENEGWFTETPYDWVVYQNDLYFSDRIGVPQKRLGFNNTQNLGIVAPATKPTLTPQGVIDPDEPVVQYALTYYNATDDSESMPVFSDEIVWHDGGIELSNIPESTDPQVTAVRIYRVGRDLTTFSLVRSRSNGTATFLDNIADIDIEGNVLRSQDWGQAPSGLKFLTEANAMFFGALGSRLYFTPIGIPTAWPPLNFLQMPNAITGIGLTPSGLLVFTEFSTVLITGTGPTSLTQQVLTTDQGCKSQDSVVNIQGAAMWLSSDGLCVSNGGQVRVVSKEKLGKVDLDVVSSVVYDEAYIAQLADQTTLVWDFAYGSIPKKWDFQVKSVVIAFDEIYGLTKDAIYQLTHRDENGFLTAHFRSGWQVSGDIIQDKVHDRFKIAFKGDIQVIFYINSEKVTTTNFSSEDFAVELVKFPHGNSRSYYVELELIGTGEVFDIELVESSANE